MFRRFLVATLFLQGAALIGSCEASPDSVVVFNEVHYNPAGTSENGEWVEVFNQMGIKVDVSGWRIDGIGYTFPPNTILDPGAYAVVAKSPAAGQLGPFPAALDNGGETLRLVNQSDRMMDELSYDDADAWPVGPDNSGSTLAKLLPYTSSGEASHWTTSGQTGGTPGAVNFPSPPAAAGIRFNEVQSTSAAVFGVELTNTDTSTANIGGLIVSVENDALRQYTLPATTLAAGGFLWIDETTLGFRPAKGENLFLYSAGKSAVIDAREATNRLRGLAAGHQSDWLFPNAVTPGVANSFAFSNGIVISEIQYNPPALPASAAVPATYQDVPLIAHGDAWRYNAADENLPVGWASTTHAVGGNWASGFAPIGHESGALAVPLATSLGSFTSSTVAYYFEREFTLTQALLDSTESLQMTHEIDDGAVFYLNGVELNSARFNMAEGDVGPESQSNVSGVEATPVTVALPKAGLVAGTNRISVEVHQNGTTSSDIVFGLKLDARRVITPAIAALPLRDSNNQWVEITNRTANVIDLSGWSFKEGIDLTFPAATTLASGEQACVVRDPALFSAAFPTARVLGTFTGSLARSGEKLMLADAAGNPADEVRYYDGGQWPESPDGGGASLELMDLDADNSAGGAWAASDESGGTAWKTYSYSAISSPSKGSDSTWSEFNLGLLAAGEIWIDDVSVIENGTTQKLVDGSFNNAAVWRLRGNHRHSEIISEPGNPGNKILRIVATGPTEHMHNQIETTLASAIVDGSSYQISFRARWVSGVDQLHTRLYFNRCAKMNVIDRVGNPGTPSAPNSRAAANIGPTYSSLRHSPAVPSFSQATTISATAADPESVASMTLFYSVNGTAFVSTPMTDVNGLYQVTISPKSSGSVVQFYIRGTDSLGAVSYYPAAGPDSRALFKVSDGSAATNGLHNFRLITTNADKNFMHTATEVMSNDRIGCTIIDREGDIYYGASVRLKSSERGRNVLGRVGYNIDFPPDGLFRGAHAGVAIDRSEGQSPGQMELLLDTMISNSGGPISRYNDLVKIISPNSSLTGTAILQMARYEDVFLDEQFENGSAGNLYEYELIYYPLTKDPSGAKYPEPDDVRGVAISNQGDDIESYRWNFLSKINRESENFAPIINYCKLFSLSGSEFEAGVSAAIDVDPWLRGMAYAVLTGADDNAASGSQHNAIYYARPDGRVIFFPHDMDYGLNANNSIFANGECGKLTADPARKRQYLGHLQDIISTTYNNSYMSVWTSHFATLDPAQNWSTELTGITNRSNNVLAQIAAAIPQVPYSITTASPLIVGGTTATISGNGWVNVRNIRIQGSGALLAVTWTGPSSWQVTIPVASGEHTVTLEALDFSGAVLATASIVVNSATIVEPAATANLVVSEIMYHPADPTAAEVNAGFTDEQQFEFIELMNIGANEVNLTGVRLTTGIEYNFATGATLAAGARIVVARDRNAFLYRHPGMAASLAAGAFLNGTGLNNGGETLILTSATTGEIKNFSYDDVPAWPVAADGGGYSLVLITAKKNPDPASPSSWRASSVGGGNPGTTDSQPFIGIPQDDLDHDDLPALVEYVLGSSDLGPNSGGISISRGVDGFVTVGYQLNLAHDEAKVVVESSEDMTNWSPAFSLVSETPTGEGTVQIVVRSQSPAAGNFFIRMAASTR